MWRGFLEKLLPETFAFREGCEKKTGKSLNSRSMGV
jgi:hypothetical protein